MNLQSRKLTEYLILAIFAIKLGLFIERKNTEIFLEKFSMFYMIFFHISNTDRLPW